MVSFEFTRMCVFHGNTTPALSLSRTDRSAEVKPRRRERTSGRNNLPFHAPLRAAPTSALSIATRFGFRRWPILGRQTTQMSAPGRLPVSRSGSLNVNGIGENQTLAGPMVTVIISGPVDACPGADSNGNACLARDKIFAPATVRPAKRCRVRHRMPWR